MVAGGMHMRGLGHRRRDAAKLHTAIRRSIEDLIQPSFEVLVTQELAIDMGRVEGLQSSGCLPHSMFAVVRLVSAVGALISC